MNDRLTVKLDGYKELAEKATKGPWWSDIGDVGGQIYVNAPAMCEGETTQAVVCRISWPHAKMEIDGEFIAASRELVPALIAALELAIEQRDEVAGLMDNWPCRKMVAYDAEIADLLDGKEKTK